MQRFELTYKQFGACSILIEWPQLINTSILNNILAFKNELQKPDITNFLKITHAYASILITYKMENFIFFLEIEFLRQQYQNLKYSKPNVSKLWKIPVCYHNSFGLDLEWLSNEKNISESEIVNLHCAPLYTVYFIGFLPGFLYLGGLKKLLYTDRKATPRLTVKKGAVAIGGSQTGVYPIESPGGWQIIGNSPITLFNVSKNKPCFASAGDKLKFFPVSLDEFHEIKTLVDAGVYQIPQDEMYD